MLSLRLAKSNPCQEMTDPEIRDQSSEVRRFRMQDPRCRIQRTDDSSSKFQVPSLEIRMNGFYDFNGFNDWNVLNGSARRDSLQTGTEGSNGVSEYY